MHRNTYLLVIFLAIFTALVVGVNIGKSFTKSPQQSPKPVNVTISITPLPSPSETFYSDELCGFSLSYPPQLTRLENGSGSAVLISPSDSTDSIIITCQKNIPRPSLAADKIETVSIPGTPLTASVAAKLFHSVSSKDGSPIDKLIFHHSALNLDILLAGYGDTFNKIIKTVKLLK